MINNLDVAAYLGIPAWLLIIIAIWSLVWMGLAMWKAARKNQMIWFIVFLVVHTLGILEILYIFWFSKMKWKSKEAPATKKKKR